MPIYRVIVTRDTTESCVFTIEAKNENEATERALDFAETATPSMWERDECAASDPYATGCDESEPGAIEDDQEILREERDRLLELLDAKCGRDIELAEEIDAINRELGESEEL